MTQALQERPIGVFDSGLGGLTVVREMRRYLPGEHIIYLGDSARVPYGTRSASTVVRYAQKCAAFLVSQGLKMLAVACNTASAVALPTLRAETQVPVLGVIAAGARSVAAHDAQRVGVIGTAGTIQSGAYAREIAALAPHCQVFLQPAPLFVPLAEEGWIEGDVPVLAATRYLKPLADAQIEVLLLGCTHYPLLVSPIKQALKNLNSKAAVVDSATAMTAQIDRTLTDQDLARTGTSLGTLTCFVTDLPASFEDMATRFLGEGPDQVAVVDIS
ncbi:MAG: glutamate racemase [Myxococcota bacterium]|nr:glutamate racemase [Myxococcota bacterium]